MFRSVAKKVLSGPFGFAQQAAGNHACSNYVLSARLSTASAVVPSVKDSIINITLIDPSGARRKVTGLVGKSLHEICIMHGIDIGPSSAGSAPEVARTDTWIEPTFGEGPTSGYDHVVLVGKGANSAARKTPIEAQMLEDHWDWDEIYEGSRLASAVVLTKDMDGITVYVPDRIVDDVP